MSPARSMTLDDGAGDGVSVLLQTYDALDAFLREMDALDALDASPSLSNTSTASCSLFKQEQQHVKQTHESTGAIDVKLESARYTQLTAALTTQPLPSSSVAGGNGVMATTASRKRKHESRTSVVFSVANNQVTSNSTSISSDPLNLQASSRPVRRRRQKDELLVLRQQALDLETQLQCIKVAMEPLNTDTRAATMQQKSAEAQAWEAHALGEKRAKHATEAENARLMEIASKERKAFYEIEKMLIKCYTNALSFLPYGRNSDLALEAHDVFLYEMLEQNADARLRDLEARSFEISPSTLQPQSHESRIVLMGDQETGVEFKRSRIVPFDSASVNKVSWKAILSGNDNLFTLKNVRVKENMVSVHAKITIHRDGEEDVELEGHHVFKRLCGKQRTFMTWEGMTQWRVASNTSDAPCLPTRESGWGVMHPLMLPGAVPVTQIEFCTTALPTNAKDHRAAGEGSVRQANLLRDLIIPSMEQMLVTHQQLIENALLDDSLSRK